MVSDESVSQLVRLERQFRHQIVPTRARRTLRRRRWISFGSFRDFGNRRENVFGHG
jgi:hypothetical protein